MDEIAYQFAPFPYFGGKRKVAGLVWERFGRLDNYVEPFFGSGAVMLARPGPPGTETVNDIDGFISNFWRAVRADPDAVAFHADWPVLENDLHARHAWLVGQKESMQSKLEGDPDWYDSRAAGWWVWGMCAWIGSGFCSGRGKWKVVNGELVDSTEDEGISHQLPAPGSTMGVQRQLVSAVNAGMGIHRKRVNAINGGQGVCRQRIHLKDGGEGIHRKRVHAKDDGEGINSLGARDEIYEWFAALSERFRHVRVCCGDWHRVCTHSVTIIHGLTGVFLDPPYSAEANRQDELYNKESLTVAHAVREWAIQNGSNRMFRIAVCGYHGEHDFPADWKCVAWKANGGYSNYTQNRTDNCKRERIWFSPHCINPELNLL